MEGNKIKSAWEIALERAEKLGKMSEAEHKKRQEEEYAPVGIGLASKYLSGVPLRELRDALARHKGDVGHIVRRATLIELIRGIDPKDKVRALSAIEAIPQLLNDPRAREIADELVMLLNNQGQTQPNVDAERRDWIRRKVDRRLKEQAISGSAVSFNVAATTEWQEYLREIDLEREEELRPLKEDMLELAHATC